MQFVDQPGAKILAHRRDAAADLDVATFGGALRLIQCRLDSVGETATWIPKPRFVSSQSSSARYLSRAKSRY
jgi:hypothetical protein